MDISIRAAQNPLHSRAKTPMSQYMDQGISIADLFRAYADTCDAQNQDREPGQNHVTESVFRHVFSHKYNINQLATYIIYSQFPQTGVQSKILQLLCSLGR